MDEIENKVEELILRANANPQKNVVLEGGTHDSDAIVAALEKDASSLCVSRGFGHVENGILTLSYKGIQFGKSIQGNKKSHQIEKFKFEILDLAEDNDGFFIWIKEKHMINCGKGVLYENEPAKRILLNQAALEMINSGWIEQFEGWRHTVTQTGRTALLESYSQTIGDGNENFMNAHPRSNLSSNEPIEVFVVHGHDRSALVEVENFLHRLKVKPIVLADKPNESKTVIEKFLHYAARSAYVIVLMTPDDVGRAKEEENLQSRARQNVIFELGYFFGNLGRKNVVALLTEKLEEPSDIKGVIYVRMSSNNSWKIEVVREMRAAGLKVDANDII